MGDSPLVLKVAAATDPHKLATAIIAHTAEADGEMVAIGRDAILTAVEALSITSERGRDVWASASYVRLGNGSYGARFRLLQNPVDNRTNSEETTTNE